MPCPYFIPTERFDDGGFAHPARLPLGAAFRGCCSAPGHDGVNPSDEELKECNLGYARKCTRLPADREADAVRFSILRDRDGRISLCYVRELDYLPRESGSLQYESLTGKWAQRHPDERVQALAECFVRNYLQR